MNIQLSVQSLVYTIISVVFLIWLVLDIADSYSGMFTSKVKGQVSLIGLFIIIAWLIFTAIWGGIFWW